jgi:flagellar hook-length control protein FliK
MSMEHGVNTSTVKTSHGAHGAGGSGYGKSPAGVAGGFASLLSGLGAEDETVGAGLLGQDLTETAVREGFDLATEDGTVPVVPGLDFDPVVQGPGTPASQDEDPARAAAAAAAALAALGIDPQAGLSLPAEIGDGSQSTLQGMAGTAAGVAITGAITGKPDANVPGDGTAAVGKSTIGLAGGRADASNKVPARDAIVNAREVALSAKSTEASTLAMDGLGLQRQLGLRNALARADTTKADALRGGGKGEDAAARLGWRSEVTAQMAQASLASNAQQAGLSGNTSFGERFGTGADARSEDGGRVALNEFAAAGALSTHLTGAAGVDTSSPLAPPAGMPDPALSAETQVAEQVSYWVARGARNAEISVEGLAENPIHITIAMQGQEASVAFRAEQAETRQVLEDAMPHLRELLEREGLTLADVSVGHSNPGWNGGSEASAQAREEAASRMRLGVRQGQEDPETPAQGTARIVPLPAGRTLDLFV